MKISWSDMLQPTLFKGRHPEPLKWELLDDLFAIWPHVMATGGILLAALYSLEMGAGRFAKGAIGIALLHLLLRGIAGFIYSRYNRRRNLRFWIRFLLVCVLTSGTAWGASIALILIDAPEDAKFIALTVACAIVLASTARAYMAPLPLIGQTLLLVIQVVGTSIAHGDWIVAPAAILLACFQLGQMRTLIRPRLRQWEAEREKDELLDEIARTNEELRQANQQLQRKVLTDELTGLPNRRAFDRQFSIQASASRLPLSLILFDVDHFKPFNDTFGHQAGDACLAAIGAALSTLALPRDCLIARYGGEEFAAVLPQLDRRTAVELAERIRVIIGDLDINVGERTASVTISLGVASLSEKPTDGAAALFRMADQALYRAKQQGRNRVEQAPDITPGSPAGADAPLFST
ncbi:GGDEF domain-containing protein [Rhizobium sp. SSA_523]|uniref:GGDEF domain-containing protein n=1 Tax=Rhizobium sp. SSA_523 TaxID=2952477 RepID=UPI00209028A6|nr:GGDEF domain-containing protein [Rhizobium sp. SSA_523]MCO5730234.1 GGDEF domain-containing protein [Rhizobium sp. SSA_523]WKC25291.1 GGDEF domain-containing protein [Rhizobium sp. SSA_523]